MIGIERQHIRWAVPLYLLQLLGSVLVGIRVYRGLSADLDSSVLTRQLESGFDIVVLQDMIRASGAWIRGLTLMVWIVLSVYILLYWWWQATYLKSADSHDGLRSQWVTSLRNIPLIATLSIVSVCLYVVSASVCVLLPALMLGDPTQMISERPWVLGTTAGLILWIICCIAIYLPMQVSKYLLVTKKVKGPWQAVMSGVVLSWSIKGYHLKIIGIAIITTLLISILGHTIGQDRGASLWVVVISTLVAQQVLLYARCVLRAWLLDRLTDVDADQLPSIA